ncbi:SAM-dependent chlorinase/fluorinase [candidate division KSB1 bacterium]|nr:SAM-dependent chlorinase/fluorinase [candidate division KSB1 bacterium]
MIRRISLIWFSALAVFFGCSSPSTIALLTDYGWDDPYAGAIQGVILSINPEVRILNLTHAVPSYNIREASYVLVTAAKEFPEKTIFLAVVDPEVGGSRKAIIVETLDQKLFVGPDNGLFTDAIRTFGFKRAVSITNVLWFRKGDISSTFHGRDVFAPAAARLSAGKNMDDAGAKLLEKDLVMLERTPAELTEQGITGEILHRDHYGNLVTNIPASILAKAGWRAGMALEFVLKYQVVTAKFAQKYSDVAKGEMVLVLNGQGLLELARFVGSAGDSLRAMAGDSIVVRTVGSTEPVTNSSPAATATLSKPVSNRVK